MANLKELIMRLGAAHIQTMKMNFRSSNKTGFPTGLFATIFYYNYSFNSKLYSMKPSSPENLPL
jgi:hypothetical protein